MEGTFNLKHRLIGAVVLIGLAVILLPRVLTGTDSESDRASSPAIRVFPQLEPIDSTATRQLNDDDKNHTETTRIELLKESDLAGKPEQPSLSSKKMAVSEDDSAGGELKQPVDTDTPVKPAIRDSVVRGWIAQIGVFKDEANAEKLIEKLASDSISAKRELVVIGGQYVTRVLLGPFGTKEEALREGNKAMMRSDTKPVIKKWP